MRPLALAAIVSLLSAALPCQDVEPPPTAAAPPDAAVLADVLERWEQWFRTGGLQAGRPVSQGGVDAQIYGELIAAGGYLHAAIGRLSHVAVLRDLLDLAWRTGSVRAARAVLGIAAASHQRRLTDPEALEIRELGHWTLMRASRDPDVRQMLFFAADGDPEVVGDERPADDGTPGADRPTLLRVAAIKALGLSRDDATREVLEAQLGDADERVRLGIAEALGRMRNRESADLLVRAVRVETHPVVAQALVIALDETLKSHRDDPPADVRAQLIRTTLRKLGTTGWRTDLALVELAEHNPDLESIPAMIRVMEGWGTHDPLMRAVNENASPILRQRAWRAVRRLTGTILPLEEPQAWWDFWEKERDNIVLPKDPVRSDARITTGTGFFGIPVTGREIAFVIDTSGSMQGRMTLQDERGRSREMTRLQAAKQELMRAVHAMPRESRYHLLTFANEVLIWNASPVPPTEGSYRALTECVARFRPDGGTNLFGGLMKVLDPGGGMEPTTGGLDCDEVFVLTDGQPTQGTVTDADAIVRIVGEANRYRRIRIHTVHVGDAQGADLMRALAESNEGIFVKR